MEIIDTHKCNICNKIYSSYSSLWNHNKNIHKNNITTSTSKVRQKYINNSLEISNYEYSCKYCDNKYAVYCVKHEYSKVNSNIKLNGMKQEWYPRKNWSSLMLFNCSHPSIIANMTLYNINNKSPQWLHRMEWCNDEMIGSIDIQYNYLVGYYNTNIYKVLHYTDGIPAYPMYRDCMYSDEWYSFLTNEEKQYLFL